MSLICSGENTWATRPMARCTRTFVPSDTAMPADSCPRCCSEKSPKYVRFATSTPCFAQIPKTPHICLEDVPFPGLADVGERQSELTLELDRLAACQSKERDLDVVTAREGLQLRHRAGRQAHDEAAGRFAEERGIHAQRRFGPDRRTAHSDAAEQAALGQSDEHSSLRAVVGR